MKDPLAQSKKLIDLMCFEGRQMSREMATWISWKNGKKNFGGDLLLPQYECITKKSNQ